MKVLVTGASGFLGRHVLSALAQEHEVVGLSRSGHAHGHRGLAGDVRDVEQMRERCRGFETLVHLAGLVSHEPSDASRCMDVHVRGTTATLTAAQEAGVRRVVYLSTSGTVAVSKTPVERSERDETPMDLICRWPYYRSKLFAEQEALLRSRPDFELVSLNPSLLLGPGDAGGEANKSVILYLQGKINTAPCGGLSFADVRDVADMTRVALTKGKAGERYLLGAANWSFADFYGRLSRATGLAPPAMTLPRLSRKALDWLPELGRDGFGPWSPISRAELELASHFWYLDDGKARAELGWAPRDPMETLEHVISGR